VNWQPIETAPKGDAPILIGHSLFKGRCLQFTTAFWSGAGWVSHYGTPAEQGTKATHWMPLPPPPKDIQG